MKQILQSLKTGATQVADLPVSRPSPGCLLIQSSHSLVSAGTERMLLDFGKANWIDKARQQPDKVQQVLEKARTDGLFTTLEAVRSKVDQPILLGLLQRRHYGGGWQPHLAHPDVHRALLP